MTMARYLAGVVELAHDAKTFRNGGSDFRFWRKAGPHLDAPSWLWSSVVE
jgi:hypothetical protein